MESVLRATSIISGGNSSSKFSTTSSATSEPFHLPLDKRLPAPPWLWPLYLSICVGSLMISPKYNLLRIGFGGAALLSIVVYSPNYDAGDVLANFATGIFMLGLTVKWVDFMITQSPERDCWRVPERLDDKAIAKKENAASSPVPNRGFWEKLQWAFSLWATDRGIGWNWKIRGIEAGKPPGYSRVKFCLEMLHEFLVSSLVLDVGIEVLARTPLADKNPITRPSIFDMDIGPRTAVVWHVGLSAVHGVSLSYLLLACITVALGICRPEQWPRLFGYWVRDAWSVRQMWGVYWHQHLRRSIKAPVDYLVKVLKVPKGTMLSRYTQLWLGFITSAVFHHGGAYALHRNAGWMYHMWLAQATAVTFEDFVMWLGKKAGIKESGYTKAIGRLWLFLWISNPWAGVTAANLFISAGSAATDIHPVHSVLSHFSYNEGCDNFYKIILDRWAVFFIVTDVLNILAARRKMDVFKVLPAFILLGTLIWANMTTNAQVDVIVKTAGLTLAGSRWFDWLTSS